MSVIQTVHKTIRAAANLLMREANKADDERDRLLDQAELMRKQAVHLDQKAAQAGIRSAQAEALGHKLLNLIGD
jgi:hypothetical protein